VSVVPSSERVRPATEDSPWGSLLALALLWVVPLVAFVVGVVHAGS
jgi:hypothetical protein